jgi:hypothetical protein
MTVPGRRGLTLAGVAWPLFVESAFRVLIQTVDTLMVSHVSDGAVAAVGMASQVVNTALMVFTFIGAGSLVVMTHHLGAGDERGADRIAVLATSINGWLGLVVSAAVMVLAGPVLRLLQLPPQLTGYGLPFLRLMGGTLVLESVNIVMSATLRARGRTRETMAVAAGQNVLNVIGNCLLLFGLLGLPRLGVLGVALSSVVARTAGFVALRVLVHRRTGVRTGVRDAFSFPRAEVRRIRRQRPARAPEESKGGYLATVQGQTTFLHDLMDTVSNVPGGRGLGVFYWEPDWIPVTGAGWYTNGGDGWDNQTLFDTAGKALASMNVFRAVSEDRPVVVATPVSVETTAVNTWVGVGPSLPPSVKVTYSDDSVRPVAVLWGAVTADQYAAAGAFDVSGTISGISLPATAAVTVKVNTNLLVNPGFETGDATGWTVTDASGATTIGQSDVRTGSFTFHWWLGAAFSFTLAQTVDGLDTSKTYQLSFWGIGDTSEPMQAFADCGGPTLTADFSLGAWTSDPAAWFNEVLGDITTTTGSCTVGVTSSAASGQWGSMDDFSLNEQ